MGNPVIFVTLVQGIYSPCVELLLRDVKMDEEKNPCIAVPGAWLLVVISTAE